MRSAHCIECGAEGDVKKFKEMVSKLEIYRCEKCLKGLIKADIVFFGEQLPSSFY